MGRPDEGAAECGFAEQIAGRFAGNPLAMLRMALSPFQGALGSEDLSRSDLFKCADLLLTHVREDKPRCGTAQEAPPERGRWAAPAGRGEGVRPRRPRRNITPSRLRTSTRSAHPRPPVLWARADASRRPWRGGAPPAPTPEYHIVRSIRTPLRLRQGARSGISQCSAEPHSAAPPPHRRRAASSSSSPMRKSPGSRKMR